MLKRYLFWLLVPFVLYGGKLQLLEGSVTAHTEILGDSTINPSTQKLFTSLQSSEDIHSLHGTVYFEVIDFISDNSERDKHMYEAMEQERFARVSFVIEKIIAQDGGDFLQGYLELHGVKRPLLIKALLKQEAQDISIDADFSIKMSDYGIKPPVLLFLSVRDQVDVKVNMHLKRL